MAKLGIAAVAGVTIYFRAYNPAKQVLRTDTLEFEDLSASNLELYAIPMPPTDDPAFYVGELPELPDGEYGLQPSQQVDVVPTGSDEPRPGLNVTLVNNEFLGLGGVATLVDALLSANHGSGLWDKDAGTVDPSFCRIYGYEIDSSGPVDQRKVQYETANLPQTTSTSIVEGERDETSTNGDGLWVIRKALVGTALRILIPEAGIDHTLSPVPNQANLNFRDYLASL